MDPRCLCRTNVYIHQYKQIIHVATCNVALLQRLSRVGVERISAHQWFSIHIRNRLSSHQRFSITFNLKRVIFSRAMFFVVYFKAANQHLVVPAIHVYKMDDIFQKFMNYSCNSNQMCLFYHPLNGYQNAVNIEPNFYAEISDEFKIDEEYCFKGKIVKYFSKYYAFEFIIALNPNKKIFVKR